MIYSDISYLLFFQNSQNDQEYSAIESVTYYMKKLAIPCFVPSPNTDESTEEEIDSDPMTPKKPMKRRRQGRKNKADLTKQGNDDLSQSMVTVDGYEDLSKRLENIRKERKKGQ